MEQKPTKTLFGGEATHCLAKTTSRNYESEKPSPLQKKKFVRQSKSSTTEPLPKNAETNPKKAISCLLLFGSYEEPKFHLLLHLFLLFNSTVKLHDFLRLQRRCSLVSHLLSRFSYSDCKRSRPGIENKFPRKSFSSLELVVFSMTRLLEQPCSSDRTYS